MTPRAWKAGDPEPDDVGSVSDYSSGADDSPIWMRTIYGEWKGHKGGDQVYTDWADVVLRWGPVVEVLR